MATRRTVALIARSQSGDGYAKFVRRLDEQLDETTFEVMGGGADDLDGGVASGADRVRRRKMNELVLPRSAGDHIRISFARAFDEHLFGATNPVLMFAKRGVFDDHT